MMHFAPGDRVRVLELNKPGHVRTPFYVREKTGRVIQFCGLFLNPEDLAVGHSSGPVVECYRVEFEQTQLWPDYDGPAHDTLVIELYHHWMMPAEEA